MKFQCTTQEKLWDLRRDHGYTLEYVADAAYSARTAHPFRKNGAPFRLKLSSAQF